MGGQPVNACGRAVFPCFCEQPAKRRENTHLEAPLLQSPEMGRSRGGRYEGGENEAGEAVKRLPGAGCSGLVRVGAQPGQAEHRLEGVSSRTRKSRHLMGGMKLLILLLCWGQWTRCNWDPSGPDKPGVYRH